MNPPTSREARPFNLARTRCALLTDPGLREEIQAHTDNEAETESILRSIRRFGDDFSILQYEIAPVIRPNHVRVVSGAWVVRAVR